MTAFSKDHINIIYEEQLNIFLTLWFLFDQQQPSSSHPIISPLIVFSEHFHILGYSNMGHIIWAPGYPSSNTLGLGLLFFLLFHSSCCDVLGGLLSSSWTSLSPVIDKACFLHFSSALLKCHNRKGSLLDKYIYSSGPLSSGQFISTPLASYLYKCIHGIFLTSMQPPLDFTHFAQWALLWCLEQRLG